jgi:hypothetical protein
MYSDHSWVRDDIYPVISEEENLNQQIVLKENELKILTDNIAKLKIKLSEEKIPSMMDVYNTIFGNGDSYFLDDDSKINAIYKGECVAYKDDWNLQISKQRAESTLLNIQW